MPAALRRHSVLLTLCAILAVALGLRLWGITWGLHDANVSRRPHPDEWVVYWVFRWFDTHHNLNPCPGPGGGNGRQCFYDWGALYLDLGYAAKLALTPVLALVPHGTFGTEADPRFITSVLAGRFLSALASSLTVLVAFRTGQLLRGNVAGLVASTVVALSGLLIQLGHFATPDSTTILFMSLALLATVHCVQEPSLVAFALAGAAAGLAAGSEYHMALLVIPVVSAWALSGRRDWKLLGIAAASMVTAWVAVNPYAVLQPDAFLTANLHSIQLRTVDSGAEYQNRWTAYGPAILYVIRYPLGYGVGFLLAAWLIAGVIWGAIRRDRATAVLLLWIVPYFLLVTVSPAKFMRYSAPLLPPLAVLAGIFLVDAVQILRGRARVLLVAVATVTAVFTFAYDGAYASLFSGPDARQAATTWLQSHATRGAAIGFEEIPNGLLNLPYFVTDAGFHPCFSTFQASNLDSRAEYFVLDDYALEAHPDVEIASVDRFRRYLQSDPQYRRVLEIQLEPRWLGLSFPINSSPHDWRYPAHGITVYRHLAASGGSGGHCFPNLAAARQALYIPPEGGGR